MAIGEVVVRVVEVGAPVLGTLGGVWLGYRTERWRKSEERRAAGEQHEREEAAAALAAQHAGIAEVLRTAADWRKDIAATVALIELSPPDDIEFSERLLTSHTAFGQALYTASVLFSDTRVLSWLSNLTALYEDGFTALRQMTQPAPATPVAAAETYQTILSASRQDLEQLQSAAQAFFAAPLTSGVAPRAT